MLRNSIYAALLILIAACEQTTPKTAQTIKNDGTVPAASPPVYGEVYVEPALRPESSYSLSTAPRQHFFVANRSGAELKKEPKGTSNTIVTATYPQLVYVYSDTLDWYKATVRVENFFQTGYMKKQDLVTELNIPLTRDDLNYGFSEDSLPGSKRIVVKLKTKNEPKTASHNAMPPSDSSLFSKTDSLLILKLAKGKKVIKDDIRDGPSTYYYYFGEAEPLNCYIVMEVCQECEDTYYLLIDKTTGAEKGGLSEPPYFSKDGKVMMTFDNSYETPYGPDFRLDGASYARATFYKCKNNSYTLIGNKSFPFWVKANNSTITCDDDHWFHMAVLPSYADWENNRYLDKEQKRKGSDYNYRFIKIKGD